MQALHDRQRERRRLARARLREADQIPALERQRNRLLLDRRGVCVAGVAHRVEQLRNESGAQQTSFESRRRLPESSVATVCFLLFVIVLRNIRPRARPSLHAGAIRKNSTIASFTADAASSYDVPRVSNFAMDGAFGVASLQHFASTFAGEQSVAFPDIMRRGTSSRARGAFHLNSWSRRRIARVKSGNFASVPRTHRCRVPLWVGAFH